MKKTEDGWVAVHRQIQEWELYFSEKFTKTQAWIDLIILANHKRNTIFIRGNKVVMERGEIGWSEDSLAKRWKWSRGKVRRYLEWLKTEQQIEHQQNSVLSKIIIVNYDQYQPNGTTDRTTDGRQIEQQTDADKNDKNDKNDKKGTIEREANVPSEPLPREIAKQFFEDITKQEEIIQWMLTKGVSEDLARKELDNFISYWTELNSTGKKQRWQMEKTFEIQRRLKTWLERASKYSRGSGTKQMQWNIIQ